MKTILQILLFLLLPVAVNASDEYALTGYNIDVKVNENNTFFITERITVQYHVPRHGIVRMIPLRNEVIRLDGTKSKNRAKVTKIKLGNNKFEMNENDNGATVISFSFSNQDKFKLSNEKGFKLIKIGDPNQTFTGTKDYVISYLYNIGKDTGKGYDEFYFNLIGDSWDTTVDGIEFTITMPKEFDASKLGFSSGSAGSTDNRNVTYEVNGNVITGAYNGVLRAHEALTVRLELPEGYFVGAGSTIDINFYVLFVIILPIIFVLIVFGAWYKHGRDEPVVETVEFYPPAGLNSADAGFAYKGMAEVNDVVSLLIYLAHKGYIAITETEEKSLFATVKGFKITKVKEYDGDNPNERLFLNGLFAKRNDVTLDDLKNQFYTTLNAIVKNINKKENRETIFEKASLSKQYLALILTAVTFTFTAVIPMLEYGEPLLKSFVFGLVFPLFGFALFFMIIFGTATGVQSLVQRILVGLLIVVLFGVVPFIFLTLPALLAEDGYLTAFFSGLICVGLMLFIGKYMLKRTPYGNDLLGKLRGFKNFLNTAEKPKLEQMVAQDPAYFYNILPFAYVLGVSDKWIRKFETITLQPPNWYSGSSGFSAAAFGNAINSAMKSASSVMASTPSSGGSSSGGGRSGGGSGGGGGRSW